MIPSVSTWSAHEKLLSGEMSFADFCGFIRENGAKGVEIVDIDLADTSLENLMALKKIAESTGLCITCMSLEHDLCMSTAEARAADVRKVKDWIDKAKAMGVGIVRVFTGWVKSWKPYPVQVEWARAGLTEIAEYADDAGIDLVLENHDSVCLGSGEILELFASIGSKRLFTCPDVFNYSEYTDETRSDPVLSEWSYAEIEPLLPLAKNAHIKICEAVGEDGDRNMDVGRMFAMLRKAGYDGSVALEFMWPIMDKGKNYMEELARAVRVVAHHAT